MEPTIKLEEISNEIQSDHRHNNGRTHTDTSSSRAFPDDTTNGSNISSSYLPRPQGIDASFHNVKQKLEEVLDSICHLYQEVTNLRKVGESNQAALLSDYEATKNELLALGNENRHLTHQVNNLVIENNTLQIDNNAIKRNLAEIKHQIGQVLAQQYSCNEE